MAQIDQNPEEGHRQKDHDEAHRFLILQSWMAPKVNSGHVQDGLAGPAQI